MIKVVRIPLIVESMDYKDANKILWQLQDEVRSVKNRTIQLLWEWNGFSSTYKTEHGCYPKISDVSKYKVFSGYAYNKIKDNYNLNTSNLISEIRTAEAKFKEVIKDIIKGSKSIPEYKSNQPLALHNDCIRLKFENSTFFFSIGLFNKKFASDNGISTSLLFKAIVKDKSQKTILERCFDGIYHISASSLIYDKKKKMWCINLCYGFEHKTTSCLEKDKILGVDLGVKKPIVASVYGDLSRFVVDGGEIEHIRKSIESRRRSMLEQGKWCGEGRIGHGRKTRLLPLEKIGDKISRCRDTVNHKYSKALIDYAISKGCGTIQMEDLKGISKDRTFLKNWSYFDLQKKIEYKAKEKGIEVVYIAPKYTSQRCSKCGYIHTENRPEQAVFKCMSCGFEGNADYNASQNISIKNIDKIISANPKLN